MGHLWLVPVCPQLWAHALRKVPEPDTWNSAPATLSYRSIEMSLHKSHHTCTSGISHAPQAYTCVCQNALMCTRTHSRIYMLTHTPWLGWFLLTSKTRLRHLSFRCSSVTVSLVITQVGLAAIVLSTVTSWVVVLYSCSDSSRRLRYSHPGTVSLWCRSQHCTQRWLVPTRMCWTSTEVPDAHVTVPVSHGVRCSKRAFAVCTDRWIFKHVAIMLENTNVKLLKLL